MATGLESVGALDAADAGQVPSHQPPQGHGDCQHYRRSTLNPQHTQPAAEQTPEVATLNAVIPATMLEPTLQMTSQVILESPTGKQLMVRALLDPGASMMFVTKRVVQHLQLKKQPQALSITGAQGAFTGSSSHAVSLSLKPVKAVQPSLTLQASVMSKVTCESEKEPARTSTA